MLPQVLFGVLNGDNDFVACLAYQLYTQLLHYLTPGKLLDAQLDTSKSHQLRTSTLNAFHLLLKYRADVVQSLCIFPPPKAKAKHAKGANAPRLQYNIYGKADRCSAVCAVCMSAYDIRVVCSFWFRYPAKWRSDLR